MGQLRHPGRRSLYLAGEATDRAHFGTVHGAYLSVRRAARQVLDG